MRDRPVRFSFGFRSVNDATSNGTAVQPGDYTTAAGTRTFLLHSGLGHNAQWDVQRHDDRRLHDSDTGQRQLGDRYDCQLGSAALEVLNTATVSANEPDPNPANNTVTTATDVPTLSE